MFTEFYSEKNAICFTKHNLNEHLWFAGDAEYYISARASSPQAWTATTCTVCLINEGLAQYICL